MAYRKDKYDEALKETPEWQYLYSQWQRMGKWRGEGFTQFIGFYTWSIANGFVLGARLEKLDDGDLYRPENCRWVCSEREDPIFHKAELESIMRYNETVEKIRSYFGMEPLIAERRRSDGQG